MQDSMISEIRQQMDEIAYAVDRPKDWVLIAWLVLDFCKDTFIVAGTAYLVFWLHHSAWWWLLAVWLISSPTLFKVLRKRYGIKEE